MINVFGKKRRKHKKSVLDNPKEFFNSMSREEFKVFLDEFGFEYIDLEDINITKGERRKEIDNMIINESYMDSPETQCDRCNNNDICKYKDQVIEVNNKISEVVFNEELPIEINVNCKKFVTKKSIFR